MEHSRPPPPGLVEVRCSAPDGHAWESDGHYVWCKHCRFTGPTVRQMDDAARRSRWHLSGSFEEKLEHIEWIGLYGQELINVAEDMRLLVEIEAEHTTAQRREELKQRLEERKRHLAEQMELVTHPPPPEGSRRRRRH